VTDTTNLPPALAARIAAVKAERETKGMNVTWMNNGKPDTWSFATKARADAFRAKVRSEGVLIE
jgi:hypothetical protein